MHRRSLISTLAALPLLGQVASPAQAQEGYPSRAVTLVIPFAPGGGTDIVGRILQQKLSERLGQSVVVLNKPGAAGTIATNFVAKAAPDGYTLFLSWDSHAINPLVYKNLPYDTFKDLVPVTLVARVPQVMATWGELPANTLSEFVALAKSEPGKLNYASVGPGNSNHLMSEYFHRLAGIQLMHVAYKGGGPSIVAMLSGEVAYSFLSYASLRGHIKSGKLKALAVAGTKRLSDIPEVPTMSEAGFPGFEAYAWMGLFAPAGTPEPVIARLNRDVVAVLKDPEVLAKLSDVGAEPVGSTPAELDAYVRKEHDKWALFVKEAGLQFE
ncbi:MAG: tripartite tricarboxylate transporter substrate binding protein [Rhodospirillales bacterium]|nr:tripartite tricarboxylate transporter substrate binding protein [Rhodospirillales bacterium]